jgi:hypothetical protein
MAARTRASSPSASTPIASRARARSRRTTGPGSIPDAAASLYEGGEATLAEVGLDRHRRIDDATEANVEQRDPLVGGREVLLIATRDPMVLRQFEF